jgi:mevalonate kinase
MLPSRIYPSKLLLFGEYSAILGSEALAIPYPRYGGSWRQSPSDGPPLQDLLRYLQQLDPSGERYDHQQLKEALQAGWNYHADIPIGYGLGSSGALTAAVYELCRKKPPRQIYDLLEELAAIESFFHGSSSGMDPLVAYLDKGVHKVGRDYWILENEPVPLEGVRLFLVNTGRSRQTAPLVKAFLQKTETAAYKQQVEEELVPLVAAAIYAYLLGKTDKLIASWHRISTLQQALFSEMIPNEFRQSWADGLTSQDYFLKLCGAGGGGFLLGLSISGQLPEFPGVQPL